MTPPPYLCRECREDLTELVSLERSQSMDVLRVWRGERRASTPTWSVRVFCSKNHENVFSGNENE